MHLELALLSGIQTREWVAVHRKHHHFSDQEGEPHSPYIYGLWHVLFGNFFYSMINSLCHMIGYRNYDNLATNLQWVALLTGGEGLHNNHHEYPSSARFAQRA
jgi:fatty-acid desaturase